MGRVATTAEGSTLERPLSVPLQARWRTAPVSSERRFPPISPRQGLRKPVHIAKKWLPTQDRSAKTWIAAERS